MVIRLSNNAEFDYFINIEDVNLGYSKNDFNTFELKLNNLSNSKVGNYGYKIIFIFHS